MAYIHPKLTQNLVDHTPRAMIAMLLVSIVYFWIFYRYVPLSILSIWFLSQVALAVYRLKNANNLQKYINLNDDFQRAKHEKYFLVSNIFHAFQWTISSILATVYAPSPYELVTFTMIIGIITAAVLSMASLYVAYLVFFFLMLLPQVLIMLYYGEHYHYGLAALSLVFIPAIILLSKKLYTSRLDIIESNDALEKNVKELRQLSITDTLTKIYNRGYFFDVAKDLSLISTRENKPLSLLIIDIDYFKLVNDNYGHQAGDFILVSLVHEIEKIMRQSDIFARLGGEEFIILLQNTSIDGARTIANKILQTIEKRQFQYNNKVLRITVSIGTAQLGGSITSIDQMYKQADKQLYKAKETGRNKIC